MKEYIILYNQGSTPLVRSFTSLTSTLVKKSFQTFDEAVEFANGLDFEVTIYESVAKTKINHELITINENLDSPTSKSSRLS